MKTNVKHNQKVKFSIYSMALALLFLIGSNKIVAQCNACFNYTTGANGSVSFMSTSTGTNLLTDYFWDFGDGTSGLGLPTATHSYSASGVYTVVLEISDTLSSPSNTIQPGCYSRVTQTINVTNAPCLPSVSFAMSPNASQQLTWNATPIYPINVVGATWYWGDNSSTSGLYPSHTYSATGWYNICVTVTVSCGNGATASFCDSANVFRTSSVLGEKSFVTVNVVAAGTTGIKKNDGKKSFFIELFPNPAENNTNLKISSSDYFTSGTVAMYDSFGKLILSKNVSGAEQRQMELETSTLNKGVYFVIFSTGNDHKVAKLIKN